jgi:hypothetical protein
MLRALFDARGQTGFNGAALCHAEAVRRSGWRMFCLTGLVLRTALTDACLAARNVGPTTWSTRSLLPMRYPSSSAATTQGSQVPENQ